MPDTKISLLSAATTLAGTEQVPVVQAGNTVAATVNQVIAAVTAAGGATLTGTQTLTNKTLTSPTINGGTHTAITSFGLRSTGAAFDLKLASAEAITADRTLTVTMGNANRTVSLAGNITTAGDFITSGAFSTTLTATAATNVTLPTSGTLATLAGTETFTNKTLNLTTAATVTRAGAAVTPIDAIIQDNVTAATSAVPVQISPRTRWRGRGWNTTTVSSQSVDFSAEVLPTTGASVGGSLRIGVSISGGTYTYLVSISETGTVTAPTFSGALSGNATTATKLAAWQVKSANYTAVDGDRLLANTSSAAFSITLPATPSTGAVVEIADSGGSFATNNLTVLRNSSTIMGLAEDMTVAMSNVSFALVYNGSTWRLA